MTDVSSPALRLMGPRATRLGPTDSLENIITNMLPDGSLCWVTAESEFFVLKRNSAVVADGFNIIDPIAGPGQWYRFSFLIGVDNPIASAHFENVAVPVARTALAIGPTALLGADLPVTTGVLNKFELPIPGELPLGYTEPANEVRLQVKVRMSFQGAATLPATPLLAFGVARASVAGGPYTALTSVSEELITIPALAQTLEITAGCSLTLGSALANPPLFITPYIQAAGGGDINILIQAIGVEIGL